MSQLSLFGDTPNTIPVTAQFDGVSWVATIAGGWWVARGKTQAEAIARVVAAYEQECG